MRRRISRAKRTARRRSTNVPTKVAPAAQSGGTAVAGVGGSGTGFRAAFVWLPVALETAAGETGFEFDLTTGGRSKERLDESGRERVEDAPQARCPEAAAGVPVWA